VHTRTSTPTTTIGEVFLERGRARERKSDLEREKDLERERDLEGEI